MIFVFLEPTVVWTLAREGHTAHCEVILLEIGAEIRLIRNGELLHSRVLATLDLALEWASAQRGQLASQDLSHLELHHSEVRRPSFDHLRAGVLVDDAFVGFVDGCRRCDPELWYDIVNEPTWPRALKRALPPRLLATHVAAFRDVADRRGTIGNLVQWICSRDRRSWSSFVGRSRGRVVSRVWRQLQVRFAQASIMPPYPRRFSYNQMLTVASGDVLVFFSSGSVALHALPRTIRSCSCGRSLQQLTRLRIKVHLFQGPLRGYCWTAGVTTCESCQKLVQLFDPVWDYRLLWADRELSG
jgi:hypothetical protein